MRASNLQCVFCHEKTLPTSKVGCVRLSKANCGHSYHKKCLIDQNSALPMRCPVADCGETIIAFIASERDEFTRAADEAARDAEEVSGAVDAAVLELDSAGFTITEELIALQKDVSHFYMKASEAAAMTQRDIQAERHQEAAIQLLTALDYRDRADFACQEANPPRRGCCTVS